MSSTKDLNFAVLGSTRGSSLIPILEAWKNQELGAQLVTVISNKKDSGILDKAIAAGVEALWYPVKGRNRESYDQGLSEQLQQRSVDFVLLVGYMRILSGNFVREWEGRILNVHPSLLPKHAGLMDLDVHRSVLEKNEKESGCTVHMVTEAVDEGPTVIQKRTPVMRGDTPEALKSRVQKLESEAFLEVLKNPRKYLGLL